jgi:hypothetical protein
VRAELHDECNSDAGSDAGPPPSNVIVNGGFESGALSPWTTCRSKVTNPLAVATTAAHHSGKYSAYAGTFKGSREPNGLDAVCQLVTIPTGGQLSVYLLGVSNDRNAKVYQLGALYTAAGKVDKLLYSANVNDRSWKRRTFDLSSLAGHRDYLAFGVVGQRSDIGKTIGLFVDDVNLTGTAAAAAQAPDILPAFDLP